MRIIIKHLYGLKRQFREVLTHQCDFLQDVIRNRDNMAATGFGLNKI